MQTAGVAPTDDSFTIIVPAESYNAGTCVFGNGSRKGSAAVDRDQNGPALVGDPDLGFEALSQFGPVSDCQLQ